MRKYVKPMIVVAEQAAEGVYMLSGGQPVTLDEALHPEEELDTTAGQTIPGENTIGEMPDGDAADLPESSETMTEDEGASDAQETVTEDVEMQAASFIQCDSKYMNGIWQRAQGGSWGNAKPTNKEMLGCTGCPADTGNGCGLQEPGADDRYWRKAGTLRPDWETAGKLPEDTPFGI